MMSARDGDCGGCSIDGKTIALPAQLTLLQSASAWPLPDSIGRNCCVGDEV
jgi:hypothetical protein